MVTQVRQSCDSMLNNNIVNTEYMLKLLAELHKSVLHVAQV